MSAIVEINDFFVLARHFCDCVLNRHFEQVFLLLRSNHIVN